jgi:hypothetical protein
MVTVPDASPLTTPEEFTVAIVDALLLHEPPDAVSVKVIDEPTQTDDAPPINPAFGNGLTVTLFVVTAVPQLLNVT